MPFPSSRHLAHDKGAPIQVESQPKAFGKASKLRKIAQVWTKRNLKSVAAKIDW